MLPTGESNTGCVIPCVWDEKDPLPLFGKSMVMILLVGFLFSSHRFSHPTPWRLKLRVCDGSLELKCLKLIFHQKPRSHWLPNAGERKTNNMKLTTPTRHQHESAQCKLYSTCSHWGSCWALHWQSACVMPKARK